MLPFGDMHPQPGLRQRACVPDDTWNLYDRYGVLEYKDRFCKDRFGLTVKGYCIQFVRDYRHPALPASRASSRITDANGKTTSAACTSASPAR